MARDAVARAGTGISCRAGARRRVRRDGFVTTGRRVCCDGKGMTVRSRHDETRTVALRLGCEYRTLPGTRHGSSAVVGVACDLHLASTGLTVKTARESVNPAVNLILSTAPSDRRDNPVFDPNTVLGNPVHSHIIALARLGYCVDDILVLPLCIPIHWVQDLNVCVRWVGMVDQSRYFLFVRQSLPSLVPLQGNRHKWLIRIACVEGILCHLLQRCWYLHAAVCRFKLGFCDTRLIRLGHARTRVLIRLVQEAHVILVGCHLDVSPW